MSGSAQGLEWLSIAQLLALVVSAAMGALVVYGWSRRQRQRERALQDQHLAQLDAEQRHRLSEIEQRSRAETSRLEQRLSQLRAQHRDEVQALERRLDHQGLFDPHHWLADARALRKEGSEVSAMSALGAGLARTQDALCNTCVELALHHFVLQVGAPTADAATHLREAERYTQLAGLLKPADRSASLLSDDVSTAMETQQVRLGHWSSPRHSTDAADNGEDEFLGADEQRAALVDALAEEASAREHASRFLVAERLAFRALTIAQRAFGENAMSTITVRDIYARSLLGNGVYAEAYDVIEAALAACSRLGSMDTERALALRMLRADVLGRLGRWELALAELDPLIIMSTQRRGPEHHDSLELRREHALALSALGHADAALHEIDGTLAVLDRIGEPEEPAITCAHAARASILNQLGRATDALSQLERVLPIAERVFGVEHHVPLSIRWQLACVLHSLHRNEEALDDIEMLLSSQEYVFGAQHPLVLQSAALRARIMRALGREAEALVEAKRLLPLHASSFGDGHRDTLQLHGLVSELEAA
ncbi:MAG: tetratricopeptide repeat protein [Steroidobacteraceae bacterium]